jgi:hypothetical protein
MIPVAMASVSNLGNPKNVYAWKIANHTGSIPHDAVDERVHSEASLLTNKLNTDIQRPQWNSPKSKETAWCLTVPVDYATVDGTVGPFTNEHIDKSLKTPANEWVEQTGEDDQPYPNSGHPDAGTLNFGGHSSISSI